MKYKVIEKPHKTFPVNKGSIINSHNDVYEWIGSDGKLRQQRLSNNFCFKEVVEKDYEILEIEYHGLRHNKHSLYFCSYVDHEDAIITKIKRLSDDEVFTIGDKITGKTYNKPREIIGFKKYALGLYIDLKSGLVKLENAKFHKKLFTTEDGVDIYEGDDCYFIEKDKSNDFITPTRGRDGKHDFSRFLYFSTKEKAEEYIENRKKSFLFTTKDGVNIYTGDSYWYVGRHYNIGYRDKAKKHMIDSSDTYFSSEEKANEYVDNKQLSYSKDDIREAIKHARVAYVTDSESFILQTELERNLKL